MLNRRLRVAFDKAVRFLPDEGEAGVYVVQLGRFRGQIEIEEAPFFVRSWDADTGVLRLSDQTEEPLDPATLHASPRDGALLCRVKRSGAPGDAGHLARFLHAAQADLLLAVEETPDGVGLRQAGTVLPLPSL